MNQTNIGIQEEWLKILGKGMVTLPKKWREEMGLEEGDVIKAKKEGNKVVIETQEEKVPYRVFTDKEIEGWLQEDKLPKALAKKVDKKLTSLQSD